MTCSSGCSLHLRSSHLSSVLCRFAAIWSIWSSTAFTSNADHKEYQMQTHISIASWTSISSRKTDYSILRIPVLRKYGARQVTNESTLYYNHKLLEMFYILPNNPLSIHFPIKCLFGPVSCSDMPHHYFIYWSIISLCKSRSPTLEAYLHAPSLKSFIPSLGTDFHSCITFAWAVIKHLQAS